MLQGKFWDFVLNRRTVYRKTPITFNTWSKTPMDRLVTRKNNKRSFFSPFKLRD